MSKPATRPVPDSGMRQAAQHAHGCGLACPVRPEETEDFALPHTEGNVVYSRERPEPFHQIVHLDGTFRPGSGRFALQPRRTQDVGKPFQHDGGGIYPLDRTTVRGMPYGRNSGSRRDKA